MTEERPLPDLSEGTGMRECYGACVTHGHDIRLIDVGELVRRGAGAGEGATTCLLLETVVSQSQEKAAADGCLGAVLASVMGMAVGFLYGFLFVAMPALLFGNGEAKTWALLFGLLVGGGSAIVGGLASGILGMVFPVQILVKALATMGAFCGLLGAVSGFFVGALVIGEAGAGGIPALLGGGLGLITGTVVGAKIHLKRQWQRALDSIPESPSGGSRY
jgi:hypothetical protein